MHVYPVSFGSKTGKVTEAEKLNYLYKTMRVDSFEKLQIPDGKRVVTVYRGKDYINKITYRPKEEVRFVRTMVNKGSKEEPRLATSRMHLRTDVGVMDVYIDKNRFPDVKSGIHLDAYLLGEEARFQSPYKDLKTMRADEKFKKVLDIIAKRKKL